MKRGSIESDDDPINEVRTLVYLYCNTHVLATPVFEEEAGSGTMRESEIMMLFFCVTVGVLMPFFVSSNDVILLHYFILVSYL